VKKNKIELIVGGTVFIALFILIAGVLWLKGALVMEKMVQYSVLFPNVGTLQPGDPVMVNGVKKGSVSTISLKGARVAVTIDLDREIVLTDASRITVQNIGLMGERMVGVQLETAGKRIQPNGKKKSEIVFIDGYFDTGIAEAMGMIGTVLTDVRALVKNIDWIVDGTVGDTSFFMQFKRIVSRLETVTGAVERLIADNRPSIERSIASLEQVAAEVNGLVDSNKQRINVLAADGARIGSRAVAIATRIDSLTGTLQTMVARLNKGEGTAGLLLKDERFYYDLKKTIVDLDTFINTANRKGIKLHITKLNWPW
jgi:phospholipid/cholesterol/gamma-HCH transport system substrate-binding protein